MTPEQKAAFINCAAARVMARIAAMQTHNAAYPDNTSVRYMAHEFNALIDQEGIGHNDVVTFFGERQ